MLTFLQDFLTLIQKYLKLLQILLLFALSEKVAGNSTDSSTDCCYFGIVDPEGDGACILWPDENGYCPTPWWLYVVAFSQLALVIIIDISLVVALLAGMWKLGCYIKRRCENKASDVVKEDEKGVPINQELYQPIDDDTELVVVSADSTPATPPTRLSQSKFGAFQSVSKSPSNTGRPQAPHSPYTV